jgi:hypothetical protein
MAVVTTWRLIQIGEQVGDEDLGGDEIDVLDSAMYSVKTPVRGVE